MATNSKSPKPKGPYNTISTVNNRSRGYSKSYAANSPRKSPAIRWKTKGR